MIQIALCLFTRRASGSQKGDFYKANDGKTVCKVRGIPLNSKSSQVVIFETVKAMVKNYDPRSEADRVQVYKPNRIVRDTRNKTLQILVFVD